jgi:hypothetical protein
LAGLALLLLAGCDSQEPAPTSVVGSWRVEHAALPTTATSTEDQTFVSHVVEQGAIEVRGAVRLTLSHLDYDIALVGGTPGFRLELESQAAGECWPYGVLAFDFQGTPASAVPVGTPFVSWEGGADGPYAIFFAPDPFQIQFDPSTFAITLAETTFRSDPGTDAREVTVGGTFVPRLVRLRAGEPVLLEDRPFCVPAGSSIDVFEDGTWASSSFPSAEEPWSGRWREEAGRVVFELDTIGPPIEFEAVEEGRRLQLHAEGAFVDCMSREACRGTAEFLDLSPNSLSRVRMGIALALRYDGPPRTTARAAFLKPASRPSLVP